LVPWALTTTSAPDQSLWSENAKAKYTKALAKEHDTPVALMNIDRLGLEVPVFVGTDRVTLNRGAGIVDGTALPGENGNVVISAHRDSYFRSLKDIEVGDAIVLRTLDGPEHFQVADISITDPLDVSVLDATDSSTLTLITCYPFYYVGFAPERYIVRALPVPADAATPTSKKTVATATAAGGNNRTNAVDRQ
jgi:sortase A